MTSPSELLSGSSIDVASVSDLAQGKRHNTSRVTATDGTQYLFKHSNTVNEQKRLYREYLHQQRYVPDSVPSPTLVESSFEQDDAYILYEWCPGVRPEDHWESGEFLPTLVTDLGRHLSTLHSETAAQHELGNAGAHPVTERMNILVTGVIEYIDGTPYETHIPRLLEIREVLMADPPEPAFTHHDPQIANLQIAETGEIEAFVDWESSRWSDPMFDLAKVEVRIIDRFSRFTDHDPQELQQQFREAYGVENIDHERLAALKVVRAVRSLGGLHYYSPFDIWARVSGDTEAAEAAYRECLDEYYAALDE